MRVAVAGSVATDNLMLFPGRFRDQLVDSRLDAISLSFLVDELVVRPGGVASNICYGLSSLGLSPVLLAAVGRDFAEDRTRLAGLGVDTESLHVSETKHTARFLCTTDTDRNQIASFYPGAMSEARDIQLQPVAERLGGLDMVVIAPDDPEAMLRHTDECRANGYPFAADPSQQLPRLDGAQVESLVDGAAYLFSNEYERGLIEQRTGWNTDDLLERVGVLVQTRGPKAVTVERKGEPTISVQPPPDVTPQPDPTGVGDGFRAGFLSGLSWGLGPERCAQLGCMVAALVIETGAQEYRLDHAVFLERFGRAYGPEAAAEIEGKVSTL